MRRYTESAFVAGNINTDTTFNDDLKPMLETMNGNLSMHNLPLGDITEPHIVNSTVETVDVTISSYGTFNNYHILEPRTDEIEFDPGTASIFSAWNDIETDFALTFEAIEGMLVGSVIVCGRKEATAILRDGLNVEVGTNGAWELRVIVNDVEIASSGYIPAGTYTIDLPFCTAIGNQSAVIKAQFRIANLLDAQLDWDYPNLFISTRQIWVRNTFR